jgi:hypothetical protein
MDGIDVKRKILKRVTKAGILKALARFIICGLLNPLQISRG